ncbi:MAG: hypothetical protein NTW76_03075 [Corynebacteriales bacterium]|uniref:Uncharacterized protein n=1 Tax=Williamsia herbipolensis TaxID=1603258 RepID=A0AAU4K446_9NOCA|nr:hypothetical protein [Williamsia herbipolensis]MCX6468278.1 hypothetical protein [Mycobacteriales bacterium]
MTMASTTVPRSQPTVVARVAAAATVYAAIATFVLVFFFAFHATQPFPADAVSNLVVDAPLWIWVASTLAAAGAAHLLGKLRAAVICDDRRPR